MSRKKHNNKNYKNLWLDLKSIILLINIIWDCIKHFT